MVNLHADRDRLRSWVVSSLNRFAVSFARKPPAHQRPVTGIEVFFYLENGRTTLGLADDLHHEPGGEMRFPKFSEMEWADWAEFYNSVHQQTCELVGAEGDKLVFDMSGESADEASVFRPFGEMIATVLLSLRTEPSLSGFPKASTCVVGVESSEGWFSWPAFEENGKVNLL